MSVSYPYPLPPSYYPPVTAAAAVAVAPEPVFTPVPVQPPLLKVIPDKSQAWPLNAQGRPISRQAMYKRRKKAGL